LFSESPLLKRETGSWATWWGEDDAPKDVNVLDMSAMPLQIEPLLEVFQPNQGKRFLEGDWLAVSGPPPPIHIKPL
jgi:hypothetical protein